MKKRFFLLNICWAFISILNATQHRQAENPLVISTAEDLKAFAKSVNSGNSYQGKVVKLSADIWLNDTVGWQKWNRQTKMKSWTPIGIPRAPSKVLLMETDTLLQDYLQKLVLKRFPKGFSDS